MPGMVQRMTALPVKVKTRRVELRKPLVEKKGLKKCLDLGPSSWLDDKSKQVKRKPRYKHVKRTEPSTLMLIARIMAMDII